MKTVDVNCSKRYPIYIGENLLDDVHKLISTIDIGDNILIITNNTVKDKFFEILFNQLNEQYNVLCFVVEEGEKYKNSDTILSIIDTLAQNEFRKNDTLISLGGGVISDMTGLAASLYMRGINLIHIPTTLLAMIDASIGGKTAIDIKQGKNLIGTYYQPAFVVVDTNIARELPKEIFNEGMAEVIKYNIISNNNIINIINNNQLNEKLEYVIEECIKTKAAIVNEDEFEKTGKRKLLNAGHTYAHALETISNYTISHGKAVGTGLVYEAYIAYYLNLCDKNLIDIIKNAVKKFNLLIEVKYDVEKTINVMNKDKKNTDSSISFILPIKLGECKETKLNKRQLKDILERININEKD